jgi:hypothetical protein
VQGCARPIQSVTWTHPSIIAPVCEEKHERELHKAPRVVSLTTLFQYRVLDCNHHQYTKPTGEIFASTDSLPLTRTRSKSAHDTKIHRHVSSAPPLVYPATSDLRINFRVLVGEYLHGGALSLHITTSRDNAIWGPLVCIRPTVPPITAPYGPKNRAKHLTHSMHTPTM